MSRERSNQLLRPEPESTDSIRNEISPTDTPSAPDRTPLANRPGSGRLTDNPISLPVSASNHASLRPVTPYDRLHGLKHDEQIQPKRHVLDVVQVVFKLFAALRQRRSIPITHLRPPGKPWANHVTKIEVRDLLRKPRHKLRALRPRPDKPHIAAQHVP